MSFHIVSIDTPQCSLSCKDGQLIRRAPGEPDKSLPLEDVAAIIITSFSASIHSHLFLEAAKHGVALIICEAFRPVSLVLPANRSTDTLLSRALLRLGEKDCARLWQATVDAKCRNQFALAERLAPDDPALPSLRGTAFGRKPHKEGICAKQFWGVFGRALGDEDFARERGSGGLNALLNYGYAVLLSTVLQKLFAVGLDPTFGISHVPRERSTPLAYDLMEPFRPCVDWRVAQWVRGSRSRAERDSLPTAARRVRAAASSNSERGSGKEALPAETNPQWEVTREFRQWVTGFPLDRVEYLDLELNVQSCIEGVVRGFRRAVLHGDLKHYRPWTPKNSKWVG